MVDPQEMLESLEPPCMPPNLVPWREHGEWRRPLFWPLTEKQVSQQRRAWDLSHSSEYQLLFGALGESYEPSARPWPPQMSQVHLLGYLNHPPGFLLMFRSWEPPPFTIQCLMNDHGFNPKI